MQNHAERKVVGVSAYEKARLCNGVAERRWFAKPVGGKIGCNLWDVHKSERNYVLRMELAYTLAWERFFECY